MFYNSMVKDLGNQEMEVTYSNQKIINLEFLYERPHYPHKFDLLEFELYHYQRMKVAIKISLFREFHLLSPFLQIISCVCLSRIILNVT